MNAQHAFPSCSARRPSGRRVQGSSRHRRAGICRLVLRRFLLSLFEPWFPTSRLRLGGALLLGLCGWGPSGLSSDLAFKPAAEAGFYTFDTGLLRGRIRLDGKSQGIVDLVHVGTGVPVAHGGGLPGLCSFYRVFSTDTRYGDAARDWPTTHRVRADGALEVRWPPAAEHSLDMTAIYQWTAADVLDLETVVAPQRAMPGFEVFLSSYFQPSFRAFVYVKPNYFSQGKNEVLAADVNPLVSGTYLMFVRDRAAVLRVFDRRWERPPHPVQWSVTRWLAGPLALRRDERSGVAALWMAPPEDCFGIATPYNQTPPDGVAGHYSLYLSLFGQDLAAGETARARCRLVVRSGVSDAQAIQMYEDYVKKPKRGASD